MEANLQEHLNDHLHFRKQKCCSNTLYIKSFHIFSPALTVFRMLIFLIFVLKILVNAVGTTFVMASFVEEYKNGLKSPDAFCGSSCVACEMLTFKMFDLLKVGHGHEVQFSQCLPSMANIELYKSLPEHFCASSHRFRDINVSNF